MRKVDSCSMLSVNVELNCRGVSVYSIQSGFRAESSRVIRRHISAVLSPTEEQLLAENLI